MTSGRRLPGLSLSFALTVLLSGCAGGMSTVSTPPLSPDTQFVDLNHPGQTVDLFTRFNADRGVPRLILLVSPT